MRPLHQGADRVAGDRSPRRACADRAARRSSRGARAAALSDTARGCTGAILAGGRASRFGGAPKGLVTLGGIRLIDRVAAALADATDECIVVVASSGGWIDEARWAGDAEIVRDLRADAGALAGIHAALKHAGRPVIVVAWDMPCVTGVLLRTLRSEGERWDADAVVPWSAGPLGFEPTCAWYAPACVAAIERRLDAGDRRAGGWLGDVRLRILPEPTVRVFGDPRVLFANVNSAEDLHSLERLISSAETGDAR